MSASVPPNTQIVQIQYTVAEPAAARSGADAYAQAFLDYRSAQSASSRKHQLGSLQSQINAVQKSLNAATAALKSQETATDAQVQVQLYTTRLSALQDSVGQLQTTDDNPGSVISPAQQPAERGRAFTVALVALGGLLGLALGAALALWRERTDDRLRISEHQTAGGVPLIGYLPFAGRSVAQGGGVLAGQENEAAVGSYRRLRTDVVSATPKPSILVIASTGANEPVAEVATNLALSIAWSGRPTVLIDATLRGVSAAELLGVAEEPGLADVLRSGVALTAQLIPAGDVNLLPRGDHLDQSRDLMISSTFIDLVDQLRRGGNHVVIAAPSITSPDGEAVAMLAERVLLLVTNRSTRHKAVARIAARLAHLDVEVLGVVGVSRARAPHAAQTAASPAARSDVVPGVAAQQEPAGTPPSGLGSGRNGVNPDGVDMDTVVLPRPKAGRNGYRAGSAADAGPAGSAGAGIGYGATAADGAAETTGSVKDDLPRRTPADERPAAQDPRPGSSQAASRGEWW